MIDIFHLQMRIFESCFFVQNIYAIKQKIKLLSPIQSKADWIKENTSCDAKQPFFLLATDRCSYVQHKSCSLSCQLRVHQTILVTVDTSMKGRKRPAANDIYDQPQQGQAQPRLPDPKLSP